MPWVEYGKRVIGAQRIAPLENGFAGEHVSLYDGTTSFSVTDIDVPGNFALPVQLVRRLTVQAQPQDQYFPYDTRLRGAGNWDVDVPYMAASYASDTGWYAQRCSQGSVPGTTMGPMGLFFRTEVWHGLTIHVPGRGDVSALALQPQVPVPSTGTYRLTTRDRDVFSCIPMRSGLTGEGFRMTTASGVSYWFDVAVTRTDSTLARTAIVEADNPVERHFWLHRNHYYLLASKIEDRFGNTVQFQYNADGHPTRIWASDGREITLAYSNGQLASATTGGRTWHYQYDAAGKLIEVSQPDGSHWQYAYSGSLRSPTPPSASLL